MIPRYSRQIMSKIWEPKNKYQIWLEIEAHACDAQAALGTIPPEAAKAVWERGSFEVERIEEINNMDLEDKLEEKSKHEVRFTFIFRDKNNKVVMRKVEDDSQDAEPRIKGIQNGCESHGRLEINDLIVAINDNPIKTIADYIKEKKKLNDHHHH